jgi:hypothetical protein
MRLSARANDHATPAPAAAVSALNTSRTVVTMPVVQDKSGPMAALVAHEATKVAHNLGALDWAVLQVRIGIGYAEINVQLHNGEIKLCEGTSEEFGKARSELLQALRTRHGAALKYFTVTVAATDPDDVKLAVVAD